MEQRNGKGLSGSDATNTKREETNSKHHRSFLMGRHDITVIELLANFVM
jgi:hypothetical protein